MGHDPPPHPDAHIPYDHRWAHGARHALARRAGRHRCDARVLGHCRGVSVMSDAPSAYRTEQAVATWQSLRARLLAEDPELATDEAALSDLLGPEEGDVRDILARCLRAAVHAESMEDAAKARAADIAARAKRFGARADSCRGAAFALMTR
jgi:hypothetical protein